MRKWLAGLLFIVSVVLLTISIYFLMGMFLQERQDNQLQHQLQEVLQEKSDETGEDSSGDSLTQIDAGILALHEENPDCIGWITIEGTRIDYPVMHRPGDKNYYLHRDFNGEYYEYFIREIKRKGIYETKVTAFYGEKLLTLSTCEYSQKNGRMVVVAKKVERTGG